ncbi:murein L,D-transpeptidase catalytic domain family protein [Pontibacter sp. KCTC 32443]|uniref:murein L,D-transpeptidase catalytic domain family protein n=1 Tax=Pontibacter TaxID=323449 RepID=UPI00164EA399|nr:MULTISPECIES: murein L,D-transpeptidase catalytic domain family protein [Pontibacter]MBC5773266.1 murein L,D-transpeptidase catalytic domain family protein [Pontibacter sp. KCTC 32443]
MLRTAILLLALSLLSSNSPEANPMATTILPASIAKNSATTTISGGLSFEQKQIAFTEHVEDIYDDADLKGKGLSLPVFQKAFIGFMNLKQRQKVSSSKSILTVVDFTKSSREKRMWVIDLNEKKLLFNTLVAHGRNTGNVIAEKFSNQPNSYMSSLGFYVTDNTYFGKHGLSLKLDGLDKGFNTNARARAIVIHGADYATKDFIKQYGRLGRSLGCPALPTEISKEVIETIKNETVLYVHSNDAAYKSDYLDLNLAVESFAADLSGFAQNI